FYSCMFLLSLHACHLSLHSFPTRRSSDLARTASTSTPISRPEEKAYRATSSQCDRLNRTSESAKRPASAGLPRLPYPSSTAWGRDRKSTRLNSSHQIISYAVFCLKKKTKS